MTAASWNQPIPFFTPDELRCRGTGLYRLDRRFAAHLPVLRLAIGLPMYPTSCCRSESHNNRIGGHPRSLHVCDRPAHESAGGAMAIDISTMGYDEALIERMTTTALSLGWSVGVAPTFLHFDRRVDIGMVAVRFTY